MSSPSRRPPYMPFLTGPPQIAVGLKPIPESKWLLPDTGLVELVVVYRPQRTKKWQAVRGLGSGRLVCNAAASPLVSLCGRRRATECRR